jgi:ATP-dependent DNA ligase
VAIRASRPTAGAFQSVKPSELSTGIIGAPFHVSPKVDGELWFMVLEAGEVPLVSNNGKAITGEILLLAETKTAVAKVTARAMIAGELFAASSGKGRPRVGDVASALAGGEKAPVERLGFMAFDLVDGLLPAPQQLPFARRLEAIAGLFASGKRVKAIKTDTVDSISALPALFADIVDGGKAEGLVVRSALGSIYKIKPEFSIDVIIIGYTARTEDSSAVRTLLLGLMREDGRIHLSGHCGNLGGDTERIAMMQRLQPLGCASSFRCPSRSGDVFTFVRPDLVAEINVTDLQPESSDGAAVRTMALQYEPNIGWKSISPMPSASWLHPVLVRMRDEKSRMQWTPALPRFWSIAWLTRPAARSPKCSCQNHRCSSSRSGPKLPKARWRLANWRPGRPTRLGSIRLIPRLWCIVQITQRVEARRWTVRCARHSPNP